MPSLVLARECMTRAVMASRLPRVVSLAGRRVAAIAACDVDADLDNVDRVAADLVDAVLEERFGLRALVLVLKGLAMGARVIDASVDVSAEVASEVALPDIARRSSAVARRWNSIYCTPMGLALFGWVEVSEMTGAGSFCWGPG